MYSKRVLYAWLFNSSTFRYLQNTRKWLEKFEVLYSWPTGDMPLMCNCCWTKQNAVLNNALQTAKAAGSTFATKHLQQLVTNRGFVVCGHIPTEQQRTELLTEWIAISPVNSEQEKETRKRSIPCRQDTSTWWTETHFTTCAPMLVSTAEFCNFLQSVREIRTKIKG